jgi:fermentation-respiration switch protein FrsA (DUF1100 family)
VLSPRRQFEDWQSAVTYLETRDDVIQGGFGAFGSGGTGGGNAVMLAAADPRIQAVVSQLPVADGGDWLHRMRSEYEWLDFLAAIEVDRRERVLNGGTGRLVSPREEIMVPTAERRASKMKSDVDGRVPSLVRLSAAAEIIGYRPIDAAAVLHTPLLVIGVEKDATTPTDHAVQVYEAAQGPKEFILQRNTSHYAAYDKYWETVTPRIVAWFQTYLGAANIVVRSSNPIEITQSLEAQA